ncbi:uracil-DNA glycosylase family protein [Sphingobium fuliginis]|uniref:Uracil-DNA glycosylase n=1 Tax=Sphingobium fuliginis ATCC 27551 TaxID=1208342 RepID=A0A5B8CCA3_SPHSA|nr:uracil-DNA glycosylase family protein [Sphingobium fuliginis]QDC37158.1 uracil-DNA glycosylase [Sphingobium fuliginis ATCC 27551]
MRGLLQENLAETANAYMAWWRLAGVDCAIGEEPTNWLRPVQEPPRTRIAASDDAPAQAKPQSFDSFLTWLAEDAAQPERRWPGAALMPAGPVNAPLMVITDMPDPADIGAGALLSERAGQLFDAMLRTIGLKRQDIHLGSLFLSRPPGAMVEASDLAAAAARMRTHVMLASPEDYCCWATERSAPFCQRRRQVYGILTMMAAPYPPSPHFTRVCCLANPQQRQNVGVCCKV